MRMSKSPVIPVGRLPAAPTSVVLDRRLASPRAEADVTVRLVVLALAAALLASAGIIWRLVA